MQHRAIEVATRLTTALTWTVGLSPAFFAVVVWDRTRTPQGTALDWGAKTVQATPTGWGLAAGEVYAVGTIALLVSVLVFSLVDDRPSPKRGASALAATGIGLYVGPVLSGLFGAHGGAGDWRLWLAPLIVAALYVAPPVPMIELLQRMRAILRVYIWGSLCSLVLAPEWATATSSIVNFRLPGVGSSRLLGVTNHPILLGVLAAVALMLELVRVDRRRLWPLHSGAAAVVLLLAQSRTAWMAALVALPLLYRRDSRHRVHPLLVRGLAFGIAACAVPFVPGLMDQIQRTTSDSEVTSLHGRTEVWGMAMSAFRSDPLWGYGPTLFTDRQSPVRGLYDHAHSQLYQTLGTSGLIGAVGLVAFATVLLVTAARTARVTAGLSWSLVAVTLTTSLTEAPLRGLGFSPYLVLVAVVVTILLAADRTPEAASETALSQGPGSFEYGRSSRSAANILEAAGSATATRSGSGG